MNLVHRILPLLLILPLPALAASPGPSLPDAPSSTLPELAPIPAPLSPRLTVLSPRQAIDQSSSAYDASPTGISYRVPPPDPAISDSLLSLSAAGAQVPTPPAPGSPRPYGRPPDLDKNGNPIPLEQQQPHRILGFMPNFRTVSAGAQVHPPGWKYNFTVATHQALDYSTFIFLGLTSLTAEGLDSHRALGKGIPGFYAYTWRGFLDKTDGTYLSAWLLPSLLHEDTRYYPLGHGHSVPARILYIISRQAITRTYGGRETPNIAGLGGKALTQVISRTYYPSSAADFSTLATKFGYSVMRDVGFSSIREFYPDIAAHYIKQHRAKVAAQSARDATPTH